MKKRWVVWYLAAAMFVIAIAPRVEAAFLPSEAIAVAGWEREADLGKLQALLENRVVTQRLQDLGFTSEEISTTFRSLTDRELHALAQKVDELRVGGDAGGVLVFLLVVALAVLIYFQVTGRRIIVTR